VVPGDVIVAIAGTSVDDVSQLLAQVAALKPGVAAQFSLQRKKQNLQLAITPGLRPRPQKSNR
jgi:S1-C subfamily serine protease